VVGNPVSNVFQNDRLNVNVGRSFNSCLEKLIDPLTKYAQLQVQLNSMFNVSINYISNFAILFLSINSNCGETFLAFTDIK